jgi:hypothetical protein
MIFISMTEDELQMHIVHWLDASLPMGSVVHHSPNEGRRHVAYKVRLKKLGMAAGWPDLEIFVPDTGWNDLSAKGPIMIELKRPKGGSLSANQKDIQERLRCCGVYCVTAKRLSHVEAYLKPLLKLRQTGQANLLRQLCEAQGG